MSVEEHKMLYRRMLEAINSRDLAAAETVMEPNAVNHNPMPGEPLGIEGFRYRIGMLLAAFPDCRFTTEDMVAEGDRVTTRGMLTGTNTGSFMGMPPTGKQVSVPYIDILRFAGGKMVEHWVQLDQLGMMQQLGVIPAASGAAS